MNKKTKAVIVMDVIIILLMIMIISLSGSATSIMTFLSNKNALSPQEELSFNLIVVPEETRVKAGETVKVQISVADINVGETGLNNVIGFLKYDERLFEYMQIEDEFNWNIELNEVNEHELYGKFCIYTMQEGVKEDEKIANITLKLKSDLKPQETEVEFLQIKSSDGEYSVDEQDRKVKITIYEDMEPEQPEQPEQPEEPGEPKEETPQTPEEDIRETNVKTGDTILLLIVIMIITILLNIVVLIKNRNAKIIAVIITVVIALLGIGISVFAESENLDEILQKLSVNQTWLNSEKYLVTDTDISLISPNTSALKFRDELNKNISIYKDSEIVTSGIVSTGMIIKTDDEENSYTAIVAGDLDKDGKSNQVELTSIIRNVVNPEEWELTTTNKKAADMKQDGKIDTKDVILSVKYIVYGELEIPDIKQVNVPTIEVVGGTYNETTNSYEDEIIISITENEENAIKTMYKIEGTSNEIEYTKIEAGEMVSLQEDGVYKISAYTYGELGNRSEISSIILIKQISNKPYRLEHYLENVDGTYSLEEAEDLIGLMNTQVTAIPKVYEGYTENTEHEDRVAIGIIASDGSLVLKLYYNRDEYNYTIQYYYDDVLDVSKTEVKSAKYESQITTYEDKIINGYEIDIIKGINGVEGMPLTISTISENNVIKVYYKEIIYSISYILNNGNLTEGETNPSTYTVNSENIILNNPTKQGYTFTGWTLTKLDGETQIPGEPQTVKTITKGSTGDREYTANWVANENTEYKVEHYLENLDGTYSLSEREDLTGETNTHVTAVLKTYEGYTENTEHEDRVATGIIAADGSLVLKLYYNRNLYTLKLVAGANIASVSNEETTGTIVEKTYKFGTQINISAVMESEQGYSYSFTRWTSNNTGILVNQATQNSLIGMPKGDVTLTASATKTVNPYGYTVQYYYDDILDITKTEIGTANYGSMVQYPSTKAPNKLVTGYELEKYESNGIENVNLQITDNESENIIKVYYKEIIYSINYVLDGGVLVEGEENPSTYTVNSENIVLNNPTKQGYIFTGWTLTKLNGETQIPGEPQMVTIVVQGSVGNREYTANWMADTNTEYKVEHYLENLDGSYTKHEIENLNGETNTQVTAIAKDYEGYTENTEHENRVATGIIASDGSLILKLYYDRNEYILTLVAGEYISIVNGISNEVQTEETDIIGEVAASYKFGENINITAILQTQEGYSFSFDKWYSNNTGLLANINTQNTSIVMPKGDVKLTATGTRQANFYNYTIQYYYDDILDITKTTIAQERYNNVIQKSNIQSKITQNTILGYEIDNTKGIDGIEGLPLTIGTISENNIIKVYYKEIIYSINYILNEGTLIEGESNPSVYTVNSEDIVLNNPIKQGYIFTGWTLTKLDEEEQTLVEPQEVEIITQGSIGNREYTANWIPDTDTEYKVEHYLENLDGTYSLTEVEEKTGETNTEVLAVAKLYEGYTEYEEHENRMNTGVIASDGGLVLKLFYNRNQYKLILIAGENIAEVTGIGNGVEASGEDGIIEGFYKFGQIVDIDAILGVEIGYNITFTRWTSSNTSLVSNKTAKNTNIIMPKGDITLTASASKTAADFGYTVLYYYDDVLDQTKTVVQTGKFGSQVISYPEKPEIGYEFDKVENLPLTIGADTSENVISVYYKLINYKVTYNLDGGELPEGVINPISYTIKDDNFSLKNPIKTNYTFSGWTGSNGEVEQIVVLINTQDAEDKEFTAHWSLSSYEVIIHHYQEGTTDKLAEDEVLRSTPGKEYVVTSLISDENTLKIDGNVQEIEREYLDSNKYNYISVSYDVESGVEDEIGIITGEFNKEVIQITYYYSVNKYNITGEVIGGNGIISNVPQEVIYGENGINAVEIRPDLGYRVKSIRLYVGDEITGEYNEDTGVEIINFNEDEEYKVQLPLFINIVENKHIVVVFEEIPVVARIISVPEGSENMTNNEGELILNNEYKTLKQALEDANLANQNVGIVEIILIADVRNESNKIDNGNNVIINLNGYTIKSNKAIPVFTVEEAELIVKDTSVLETGKIISIMNVGIWVTPEGSFTLGVDEKPISYSSPYVEGINYGVYKEVDENDGTEGIFNFYDGKIMGEVAISGMVNETPLLYSATVMMQEGKQIGTLAIVSGIEGAIGKKTYINLEDAFSEANLIFGITGQEVEIDVLAPEITLDATIEIEQNRNIVLDLNGNTVMTTSRSDMFRNKGEFSIIDSTIEEHDLEIFDADGYFKNEDGKLKSQNINRNTESKQTIMLDLSNETEMVDITINAEISTRTIDYGYVIINESRVLQSWSGSNTKLININGITEAQDYITQLEGGRKYFLHIGYYKANNTAAMVGDNTFTINSIKINGEEQTVGCSYDEVNFTGKIVTSSANIILNDTDATFTLNSGILQVDGGTSSATVKYVLENNGQINVNGGLIYTTNSYGRGILNNSSGSVKVNGGKLRSNYGGVNCYNIENKGEVEINEGILVNGTNNKSHYNIYNTVGTITVNNGCIRNNIYNYNTSTTAMGIIVNNGDINSITSRGLAEIHNLNTHYYTSVSNLGVMNIYNGKFSQVSNDHYSSGRASILNFYDGEIKTTTNSLQTGTNTQTNIYGGIITSTSTSGNTIYIGKKYNVVLNIENAVINGEYIGIWAEMTGNITVKDSIINISSATTNGTGIYLHTGSNYSNNNIKILGETQINVESVNGYGIQSVHLSDENNITIGTKDGEIDTQYPQIKTKYQAISTPYSTVNYYDGVLIGNLNNTINGTLNEIEEDCEIVKEIKEDGFEHIILGDPIINQAKISKDYEIMGTEYISEDEYYYYFNTLQKAINSCNTNNEQVIIEIIEDNIYVGNKLKIEEDQNIKLDLKSNRISAYNKMFIENYGTLEIIDEGAENTLSGYEVVNNGTYYFVEEDGKFVSNNTNNTGTANSYVEIDLSDKSEDENFEISMLAEIYFALSSGTIGYATITTTTDAPAYNLVEGRFMYIQGFSSIKEYTTTVKGGQVYYLHFGYRKTGNSASVDDKLEIYKVSINKKIILGSDSGTISTKGGTLFKNFGELTIINGKYNSITSGGSELYINSIINNGILNIQGGLYRLRERNRVILNEINGILNMTGGKIESVNDYSIGVTNNSEIEVNISNVNIMAYDCVYLETGNINIQNCELYSYKVAVNNRNTGNIVVEDSIITAKAYGNTIYNNSTGIITLKNNIITNNYRYYSSSPVINNYGDGTINIEDCKITTLLGVSNSGIMNIKQSEINVSDSAGINNTGILNIELVQLLQSGTASGIEQKNTSGVITIKSGLIKSAGGYGINITNGILNIGEQGGVPSKTDPEINGKTYGLYVTGGTINYFDGIIKGSINQTIYGTITQIEEGYEIIKTVEGSIESAVLDKLPMVKITSTGEEYNDIQDAINSIEDNTEETIEMLRNAVITNLAPSIVVEKNKKVVLDLKGYKIQASNTETFINSGELNIISTQRTETQDEIEVVVAEAGTGSIVNYTGTIFVNNEDGELNFNSGKIMSTPAGSSNNRIAVIINNGICTINGGYIDSVESYKTIINNNKDVYIKSGTIDGNYSYNNYSIGINNNNIDCNVYMEGGLITNQYIGINNGTVKMMGGEISAAYGVYISTDNIEGIELIGGKIHSIVGAYSVGAAVENTSNSLIKIGNTITSVSKGIYNNGIGSIEIIDNADIQVRVINNSTGTITIKGENININTDVTAISNDSTGTINIYNGNIISSRGTGYAISNNSTGIINIGENDGIVNMDYPIISNISTGSGESIGVYNRLGIVNYYDGVISGKKSVNGIIGDIPEGKNIISSIEGTTETYKLVNTQEVAQITINDITTSYNTIFEAIDACEDSVNTTIKLLDNIILNNNRFIQIDEQKDIILDLNGKEIRGHKKSDNIINNGKLEIIDTAGEDSEGKIFAYGHRIISNTKDLKITSGVIMGEGLINQNIINNTLNGNIVMDGGLILSTKVNYTSIAIYSNTGTINLNGGTIQMKYASNSYSIYLEDINELEIQELNVNGTNIIGNNDNGGEVYNGKGSKINMNSGSIYGYQIDSYGEINIYDGTIKMSYWITNWGVGELNIFGGNILSEVRNYNNLNITGGTITCSGIGIRSNSGSITTIGNIDYPVSTSVPYIYGSTNAISRNGTGGIINFYDGKLEGGTLAISGSINNIPELYSIQLTEDGKIATLGINATFEQVAKVNDIYFNTLQAAVDATTNGIIEVEKNIILSSPIIINPEKDITIDLKYHSITGASEGGIIINNGNLKVIDSKEDGNSVEYGIIENLGELGIQNNGTLTIGVDDENVHTNSPRIQGGTYGIENSETGILNFYDGIIKGITGAINGEITSITDQSGYVVKEGTEVINEKNYITKYLGM